MSHDANRTTEYKYTVEGQLSELIVRNSVTGDQVTRWHYGTTLAESGVASKSLLRTKVYPDSDDSENGGDGSDEVYDRVEVSYNRQGEVVGVLDQNETEHRFEYDGLGRLTQDRVTELGSAIDGAIRRISRQYDRSGRLERVGSWDNPEVGQGSAINEVLRRYNGFGQLTREYQSHSGLVATGGTPVVQYAYADGANRHIRKLSTTYPSGRKIAFSYGATGSADDKLGRVHEIQDASDEDQVLARYTRRGISATMRIEYPETGPGNPLEMTYIKQSGESNGPAGDQYTGQDQFNRIIDIRWLRSGTTTHVDRIQYGFDRAGNRLWRKNVVAGSDWDELYGYDGLYQLPDRQRGTLNSGHTALTGTPLEHEEFDYDPAGNWMSTSVAGESDGYVLVGTVTELSSTGFAFGHLIGTPPVAVSDTIEVDGTPFTVTAVTINSPQDPETQDGYYEIEVAESTSGLSNGDPIAAEGDTLLPQERAHNRANEITYIWPPGSANPAYDAAGNLTLLPPVLGVQPVQREFTWDAWNRLVKIEEGSATLGEYAYDGFARRVWKESDEGGAVVRRHFYYSDQWQVLEERLDESDLADRTFVWGLRYIDDLILRDRGTQRLYATHDQWHVISTVGVNGNATERFAYRAFGTTQVLAPDFTPRTVSISGWERTYGVYRHDAESGLYAVRFRYLHSGLGRWLSRDPIGERGGLNLFCYVTNGPAKQVDPSGLIGGSALTEKDETCSVVVYLGHTWDCIDMQRDMEKAVYKNPTCSSKFGILGCEQASSNWGGVPMFTPTPRTTAGDCSISGFIAAGGDYCGANPILVNQIKNGGCNPASNGNVACDSFRLSVGYAKMISTNWAAALAQADAIAGNCPPCCKEIRAVFIIDDVPLYSQLVGHAKTPTPAEAAACSTIGKFVGAEINPSTFKNLAPNQKIFNLPSSQNRTEVKFSCRKGQTK